MARPKGIPAHNKGVPMSPEQKAKIRQTMLERGIKPLPHAYTAPRPPCSPEKAAKISAAQKGKARPDVTARNLVDNPVKKPGVRERISETLTGRPGRPHTEATKAKMSAIKLQNPVSSYAAAHLRMAKLVRGTAAQCAHADDTCKGRLESALRWDTPLMRLQSDAHGRWWSNEPTDYHALCVSHHRRYDADQWQRERRQVRSGAVLEDEYDLLTLTWGG